MSQTNGIVFLADEHPTAAEQDLMLDILAENAAKGAQLGMAYDLGPYDDGASRPAARSGGVRRATVAAKAARK